MLRIRVYNSTSRHGGATVSTSRRRLGRVRTPNVESCVKPVWNKSRLSTTMDKSTHKPKKGSPSSPIPKEEAARRAAQSARDKRLAGRQVVKSKARQAPARTRVVVQEPSPAVKRQLQALNRLIPETVKFPSLRGGLGRFMGMSIVGSGRDSTGNRTWKFMDVYAIQQDATPAASLTRLRPATFPKIASFSAIFGKVRLLGAQIAYLNEFGKDAPGMLYGQWDYEVNQADALITPSIPTMVKEQLTESSAANRDFVWDWSKPDLATSDFVPVLVQATGQPAPSFHGVTEDRFYFQPTTSATGKCCLYLLGCLEFSEALV